MRKYIEFIITLIMMIGGVSMMMPTMMDVDTMSATQWVMFMVGSTIATLVLFYIIINEAMVHMYKGLMVVLMGVAYVCLPSVVSAYHYGESTSGMVVYVGGSMVAMLTVGHVLYPVAKVMHLTK
jgi:hypothetical protein